VTESTLERALVELQGSPPKALATRLAAGDPLPVEIAAGSLEVKLLRVCVVDDTGEPLEVERVDEAVRRHFEQHDAYERRFVLADPDEADVFFERLTDGDRTRGRIVPARLGSLSEHEFTLSGSAGSLSSDDLDLVATAIGRVYRADGLRRIGEDPGAGTLPEGVEFVVERVGGDPGPNEPISIVPGQTISPGTKVSAILRNNTDRRLYVYGYYLGSDLEPSRLFPPGDRKDGALVRPGEKVDISEPEYFNDLTVGVEEFVCFVGDDELSLIPNLMKPQKTAEDDRGGSTRGGRDRGAAAFIEDLTFGVDGSSRTRSGGRTPQGSAWVEVLPVEVRWPATSPPIPEGESSFDGSPHDLLRPKVDALPRGGTFAARRVPSRSPSAVDGVYTACGPSVVVVRTRAGHGTGFLVDAEKRWILTSHHVVEPGARYDSLGRRTVSILGGSLADDGFMEVAPESAEAIVLHTDERRDLALLEVVGSPSWLEESAAVTIADESPPGPGATCAILGHPSSDMLWTLRGGRTAADGRAPHDLVEQAFARPDVSTADAERILRSLTDDAGVRILVTDCAASPGDSGGPLVDAAGRLLGVTILVAADLRDDERSYYVHVDEVRAFLAEARTAVRRSSAPTPRTPRIGSATIRPSFAQPESSGKRTVFSVSATDRSEIALHFDLNGDPDKTTALDASAGRDRGWREDPSLDDTSGFELVLAYTPFERTAFYDTDVDGKFDLVLIDDDEDPGADARFDRLADGTWSFHEVGGEDWLEISKRLRKVHEGPPDQPAPSYEETLERVARALGVL
ncbi:MAG: trypsin-like peptidase domain-containing protein, partial [Planctomycetota bacterium]